MAKSLQHYIYNNEVRIDSNRLGSLAASSSVSLLDIFLDRFGFQASHFPSFGPRTIFFSFVSP